jgi:formate-dependent nitrite reductase cytochrome c552 subunit
VIGALILFAMAIAEDPVDLCAMCHPDVRVEFERGIHTEEEVACVSCHGGDSSVATVEGAHRGDFRGKIRRRDVPSLCASCHAEIRGVVSTLRTSPEPVRRVIPIPLS